MIKFMFIYVYLRLFMFIYVLNDFLNVVTAIYQHIKRASK